jgi:hypothetical protein
MAEVVRLNDYCLDKEVLAAVLSIGSKREDGKVGFTERQVHAILAVLDEYSIDGEIPVVSRQAAAAALRGLVGAV